MIFFNLLNCYHSCGKFHIIKVLFWAAIVRWLCRHCLLSLSESKGGQTVRGEGLRVHLSVNLSTFAQAVYICHNHTVHAVHCLLWAHKRHVHCKNKGHLRVSAEAIILFLHLAHGAMCDMLPRCRCLKGISKHTHTEYADVFQTLQKTRHIRVTTSQMLCNAQEPWRLEHSRLSSLTESLCCL